MSQSREEAGRTIPTLFSQVPISYQYLLLAEPDEKSADKGAPMMQFPGTSFLGRGKGRKGSEEGEGWEDGPCRGVTNQHSEAVSS